MKYMSILLMFITSPLTAHAQDVNSGEIPTISKDSIIANYRQLLMEANERVAIAGAQIEALNTELQQEKAKNKSTSPTPDAK